MLPLAPFKVCICQITSAGLILTFFISYPTHEVERCSIQIFLAMSGGCGIRASKLDCLINILNKTLPVGSNDWDHVTEHHMSFHLGFAWINQSLCCKFAAFMMNTKKIQLKMSVWHILRIWGSRYRKNEQMQKLLDSLHFLKMWFEYICFLGCLFYIFMYMSKCNLHQLAQKYSQSKMFWVRSSSRSKHYEYTLILTWMMTMLNT